MSQHDTNKTLRLNVSLKDDRDGYEEELGLAEESAVPSIRGMPLKYISLVTLAAQNSLLTIIMHYSRVSTPPSRSYSAGTAVLLNELLKGAISLAIACASLSPPQYEPMALNGVKIGSPWSPGRLMHRFRRLGKEVFSPDCWKLSIPAILYVIQNNLQYVAASNLEAAPFQVSYQLKILTTAACSVILLRKKLSPSQWLALLFLAIGVGIVQIQAGAGTTPVKSAAIVSHAVHSMNPLKGFLAVAAACFTSGLAGVYFEMVLKNSPADLWVRNVQLSLFSLIPALVPIILSRASNTNGSFWSHLFRNFGGWAWATVAVQVLGGLVTALVIKYSDNILKGFATSLSIVVSFLASVALFDFQMTFTFILGSVVVLIATWLYNQPKRSGMESLGWSLSWSEKGRGQISPRLPLTPGLAVSPSSRTISSSSLSSLASTLADSATFGSNAESKIDW